MITKTIFSKLYTVSGLLFCRCTHHIYVINTPGGSCYLLKCSNIQSIVDRSSTADIQRMELHGHQAIQRSYTREKEVTLSRSRCRRRSRHRRRAAQPLDLLVTRHRRMRCATTTSSDNRDHRLYYASHRLRGERATLRVTC